MKELSLHGRVLFCAVPGYGICCLKAACGLYGHGTGPSPILDLHKMLKTLGKQENDVYIILKSALLRLTLLYFT